MNQPISAACDMVRLRALLVEALAEADKCDVPAAAYIAAALDRLDDVISTASI
ncbi:hypothetical protein HD841_000696 [Sphingomonas melonis]|uniref:Uncharacterized protein n=1 Tax=Sphingomonas melonis TaxID=152682 RepID=A0A7Y9FL55_9SPHN|nr:hypothetical protein [Sphingomonas melonis]